jgi:general secretion pathway protein B
MAAPDGVAQAAPAAAQGGQQEAVEHYGPPLTTAAPPAPAAIRKFDELPPSVRAQMPRLSVGGAIYSDTPSGRMLILNGQIYHEGERPTPDTVLEQIHLKSAVLNYRGLRYEINY